MLDLQLVKSEFLNLNMLRSIFGIHFLNLLYFADILGQKQNSFMLKGGEEKLIRIFRKNKGTCALGDPRLR